MRLIALLFVVAIVAASADPLAPLRTIISNDECSISRMEELKPQLEEQINLLHEVPSPNQRRTRTTSLPSLSSSLWSRRLRLSPLNVVWTTRFSPLSATSSRPPVLLSSLPPTAPRTSESCSSCSTPSSRPPPTGSTTSSSASSAPSSASKAIRTAASSSTSSLVDLVHEYTENWDRSRVIWIESAWRNGVRQWTKASFRSGRDSPTRKLRKVSLSNTITALFYKQSWIFGTTIHPQLPRPYELLPCL